MGVWATKFSLAPYAQDIFAIFQPKGGSIARFCVEEEGGRMQGFQLTSGIHVCKPMEQYCLRS